MKLNVKHIELQQTARARCYTPRCRAAAAPRAPSRRATPPPRAEPQRRAEPPRRRRPAPSRLPAPSRRRPPAPSRRAAPPPRAEPQRRAEPPPRAEPPSRVNKYLDDLGAIPSEPDRNPDSSYSIDKCKGKPVLWKKTSLALADDDVLEFGGLLHKLLKLDANDYVPTEDAAAEAVAEDEEAEIVEAASPTGRNPRNVLLRLNGKDVATAFTGSPSQIDGCIKVAIGHILDAKYDGLPIPYPTDKVKTLRQAASSTRAFDWPLKQIRLANATSPPVKPVKKPVKPVAKKQN
eukprot:tig00020952_g16496.t1